MEVNGNELKKEHTGWITIDLNKDKLNHKEGNRLNKTKSVSFVKLFEMAKNTFEARRDIEEYKSGKEANTSDIIFFYNKGGKKIFAKTVVLIGSEYELVKASAETLSSLLYSFCDYYKVKTYSLQEKARIDVLGDYIKSGRKIEIVIGEDKRKKAFCGIHPDGGGWIDRFCGARIDNYANTILCIAEDLGGDMAHVVKSFTKQDLIKEKIEVRKKDKEAAD